MIASVAVLILGLIVGLGTLGLVLDSPGGSLAGSSALGIAALLAAGWLAVGVGVPMLRRRRWAGALFVAAGLAWFIAEWNNPGVDSPIVFTVGLVGYAAWPVVVAHAALAAPTGRLSGRLDVAALAAAYASSIGVLGFGAALAFEPAEQGCAQCPGNLVAVADDADIVAAFNRLGVRLGVAWSVGLAGLVVWRVVRSTPAVRRNKAPILLATAVLLAATTATYVHALDRDALVNDETGRRLWLIQAAALVLVALGVVAGWVRVRRSRAAVADMVVQLAETPPTGGLRAALADTLGDPDLEIAYPVLEGGYADAVGIPIEVAVADRRARTVLVRDGATVAVVLHRADLLGDPRLVEDAASAAAVAFEHERLQAEAKLQLARLRSSRARLVETSDAERRRLERDLHDGAQQRLVGAILAMRLVRTKLPPGTALDARLAQAEDQLRSVVDDVRELASGIHPAVLTDYGLGAAIDALAERGSAQVRLISRVDERFPAAVELTAYLIVAAASKVGPVELCIAREDSTLRVDVDAAAEPPEIIDLRDRVGVLDGSIEVMAAGDGVRIRAVLPCG